MGSITHFNEYIFVFRDRWLPVLFYGFSLEFFVLFLQNI